jgi:hypothetical protein
LWHRQAIHKGQEFFRQVACLRWLRVETSRTSMPTRLPTREAGLWALVVRIGHPPLFVRLVVLWWYVPLRLLKLPEVREWVKALLRPRPPCLLSCRTPPATAGAPHATAEVPCDLLPDYNLPRPTRPGTPSVYTVAMRSAPDRND